MKSMIRILLPALVFLIPLSVYLYTLAPAIMAGDNTEMVTAAAVLGIPHHSSYPVNTIIGHMFSRLPMPMPLVWKINASAAFLQSLAVMVFYFLCLALFKLSNISAKGRSPSGGKYPMRSQSLDIRNLKFDIGNYLVAFSASLFFAFNLIFWNYGTKFEVFALNNLLVMLVLLLAVRLRIRVEQQKATSTPVSLRGTWQSQWFGIASSFHSSQ